MSATIQWLLEQASRGGFELLAGEKGLSNAITSVNIMDNPDTLRWLTEGELVLTTGYLFLENTWLRNNIISELSQKGCAGIGFVLKRYIDQLPVEMINQANRLGFPILSIPYELSLAEVVWLVYQKNFEEKMSETERMASVYKKFAETLANEQSVTHMLSDIVGMVGCPALLLDADFHLIEYDLPESMHTALQPFFKLAPDQPVFPDQTVRSIRERFARQKLVSSSQVLRSKGEDLKCSVFPILEEKNTLGYLCLCEASRELCALDYQLIQTIQPVLSICLIRRIMRAQLQINTKNDFIKIITSREPLSLRELQMQCDLYQFDYHALRVCLVIQLEGYGNQSIRRRKELGDAAYDAASLYLEARHPHCYKLTFQHNLILFFFFPEDTDPGEAVKESLGLSQGVMDSLTGHQIHFWAGFGKAHSGADTISLDLHQAFEAIRLGRQIHPDRRLYSYLEDQLYHILAKSFNQREALELYNETLGRLKRFDEQNGQDLCPTVKTFLKNRLNTTETARELFLHRNTMFYRLERIKEVLGCDPRDLEVALNLLMGSHLEELLGCGLLNDSSSEPETSL